MSVRISLDLDVDRALLMLAYVQNLDSPSKPAGPLDDAIREVKKIEKAAIAGRRARADKGNKRGKYKSKKSEAPAFAAVGPTIETLPSKAAVPPTPLATAPVASDPTPSNATLDTVRAALKVMQDSKGLQPCLALLATYGVKRVSDLPEDKYAEFIAATGK